MYLYAAFWGAQKIFFCSYKHTGTVTIFKPTLETWGGVIKYILSYYFLLEECFRTQKIMVIRNSADLSLPDGHLSKGTLIPSLYNIKISGKYSTHFASFSHNCFLL